VFREAGMQASPVTMSCPSQKASAPPCLPLFIKGPLIKKKKNLNIDLPYDPAIPLLEIYPKE
jgi:hypothetical protein